MAFPDGWARQCELVIQSSQVGATLTNFPLLLTEDTLPSEMFDADGSYPAQNGGGDIRFSSDSAGASQLACEIVDFTTDNTPANGTAEIWVKVPSISSSVNTSIYVWYNTTGTDSQPAVTNTYGRNAVWSDYEWVAHTTTVVDSTGNHSITSASTALNTGETNPPPWGDYRRDPNAGATFYSSSLSGITEPLTLQCWAATQASGDSRMLCLGDSTVGTYQLNIGTNYGASEGGLFQFFDGTLDEITTTSHQTSGTFYCFHAVATASNDKEAFMQGSSIGTSTTNISVTGSSNGLDRIGFYLSQDSTPFGDDPTSVAEARLRLSALSSSWIAAEYANQNSASTFVIEQTPADAPTGATNDTATPAGVSAAAAADDPSLSIEAVPGSASVTAAADDPSMSIDTVPAHTFATAQAGDPDTATYTPSVLSKRRRQLFGIAGFRQQMVR